MGRWTCPRCDREFERRGQSHVCAPGGTVEETFRDRPPEQLQTARLIIAQLERLGPLHVDAVRVGVFLKTQRKLAEIRPKKRWVSLELVLPEPLHSARVTRTLPISHRRVWHTIRLSDPAEVDSELVGWLERAYDAATD